MITHKKHAPHAPGPRLGTWHKQQRPSTVEALKDRQGLDNYTAPPIYTKPQGKKQKLGEGSFHPAMKRLPRSIKEGSHWRNIKHKRGGLKG